MSTPVQRRDFLTLLGGAAAAWPLAARAQQRPAMPVVGFLGIGSPETTNLTEFRRGLSETGFIEGRNVAIEYRWAYSRLERLPELAADLVHRRVAVVAAWSGASAARAVKTASATTPIVFQIGDDPVEMGLVDSLNRPGGNITGITSMSAEILAKRLELLHKIVPQARRIALLVIAITPDTELLLKRTQAAAASIGLQLEVLTASTDREIDAAFNNLIEKQADALLVQPTALFYDRRVQIITLAARHAVPASYFTAGFVDVGGLMSYGPKSYDEFTFQGGVYVGRILKGEKAGDLPVMRPTRFEFIINAQTARTIGLTIAPDVLAIADEVIE